jgi:hypothetical protein
VEAESVRSAWRWEVPDKPVAVELDLAVVDSLSAEILRAVGAVPRRGIEVGGILLGTVTPGSPALVHIRDFEAVPIEYMHGPSYVPSERDFARFAEAVRRPHASPEGPLHAVGYYRSHTRDGLALAPEDVKLLSELFPENEAVILLVHPSVLHASTAGFFFRENGVINGEKSALEFPFRRPDLGGGPVQRVQRDREPQAIAAVADAPPLLAPVPPPLAERPRPERRPREFPPRDTEPDDGAIARFEARPPLFSSAEAVEAPTWSLRAAWAAFILALLLFGIVAGYHASGGRFPPVRRAAPDAYALRLSAVQNGDGLLIRWNTEAPAIQAAWRGVLNISEGEDNRAIQLDLPQLRNGSVLYRHIAPSLRLRLDVYLSERRMVSEIADWGMQSGASTAPAEIAPEPSR